MHNPQHGVGGLSLVLNQLQMGGPQITNGSIVVVPARSDHGKVVRFSALVAGIAQGVVPAVVAGADGKHVAVELGIHFGAVPFIGHAELAVVAVTEVVLVAGRAESGVGISKQLGNPAWGGAPVAAPVELGVRATAAVVVVVVGHAAQSDGHHQGVLGFNGDFTVGLSGLFQGFAETLGHFRLVGFQFLQEGLIFSADSGFGDSSGNLGGGAGGEGQGKQGCRQNQLQFHGCLRCAGMC